jgi:Baseplate J-like protein
MKPRRRAYPEILESMLTSVSGGVAAEPHAFPPAGANGTPPSHHLLENASRIVSVYGSFAGDTLQFKDGADYELSGDNLLLWKEGGKRPDEGTLIQVNYLRKATLGAVTDLNVGSVVRTLLESVGLELALIHAQLGQVYDAGFLNSATGRSLDNVVGLLGIERVVAGRASGTLEFTRTPGTRGSISIPAGTRVLTEDGEIEYETTESVSLVDGQDAVRVAARDIEPDNEPLPADALIVLAQPIASIASVTNPVPTAFTAQDETDEELRERARNFLHASERATVGALEHAIRRQQVFAEVIEFPTGVPGYVDVVPHTDELGPELQQRLLTAIHDARPAGVKVELKGVQPPRRVNLELRLTTGAGLPEDELRRIQVAIGDALKEFFAKLPVKKAASLNRIVGLVLDVPGVDDVQLLGARWDDDPDQDLLDREAGIMDIEGFPTELGALKIVDPSLPTALRATIAFPVAETPAEQQAIIDALGDALFHLNSLNAAELPNDASDEEKAERVISFAKLLRSIPLPDKPAEALADVDEAPAPDVAPYQVEFVLTRPSFDSQTLSANSDPGYELVPFERVTLHSVEIEVLE